MEISQFSHILLTLFVFLLNFANKSLGARRLTSLYEPPHMKLKYHNGNLLQGNLPITIVWYGKFTPAQRSIISDFFLSLNKQNTDQQYAPLVSTWWGQVQFYLTKAGKKGTNVTLSDQFSDENCSLGKLLRRDQISELAQKYGSKPGELTVVLTADDVAVEGFCMSSCGFHGSNSAHDLAFIWVGNSVTQCPGQCAWPFHQPIYGPQTAPLGAPNGDVAIDGMIINVASLLAGTVTNPFKNGYFQGSADAPLEVASACTGVYGKGAYPGYAGELLVDPSSGASYNAHGVNGRKYLLPALFDPITSKCTTLVRV